MQEKQPLGLPERVVKITGSPDQLLRAVALLLTKLVESPNYARFTTSNVSYGPPAHTCAPFPPTFSCLEPVTVTVLSRIKSFQLKSFQLHLDERPACSL